MTILAVVLLIMIGLGLILLEFLVVPGVTVAGIGGTLMIAGGVYLSYNQLGTQAGNITLGSSFLIVIATVVLALRSRTWKKLMLRSSINSKVNTFEKEKVKEGDTGVAVSRLAPMGKVLVNNEYYEAKANNTFIDQETEVIVSKVESGRLIVKPKIIN